MADPITCTVKAVPADLLELAAQKAVEANALNAPSVHVLRAIAPGVKPTKLQIAAFTTKYWGPRGVNLTVGFLDGADSALRARILFHMNVWGRGANVRFRETATSPDVRIARLAGDGYWSYVGTDIHVIPADEPTLNLDSFTNGTPESEFVRVVRHEAGHTLGFPHEHMRKQLVDRIDEAKAIAFFLADQGWDEATTRAQVLTPIEEAQLIATPVADADSIMCYQIPGSITKDGTPIVGGTDIDAIDKQFTSMLYPPRDPQLQSGSTGQDVRYLQEALDGLGFTPGPIDGIFGTRTAQAVTAYQTARGLTVDGIVGPQTWSALHADGW